MGLQGFAGDCRRMQGFTRDYREIRGIRKQS